MSYKDELRNNFETGIRDIYTGNLYEQSCQLLVGLLSFGMYMLEYFTDDELKKLLNVMNEDSKKELNNLLEHDSRSKNAAQNILDSFGVRNDL